MTARILQGDCLGVLRTMPAGSVHCVVTSPPYWGLRDYGVDGQIGLEPTPDEYIAEMVAVFREVRRVLRDDGTCWLNLGDSYAGSWGAQGSRITESDEPSWHSSQIRNHPKRARNTGSVRQEGLKPKDLIGIPWMVAFALRADGWWLRQDNVWAKRNCMPESIRDRTTRAHEYVFQLTKSGASTFWTHRHLDGVRSRPEPDYLWIDGADGREQQGEPPAGWQDEKLPGGKKRWRRVNLWQGNDYFYDAVAIEEEGDIPAGTRAAKGSNVRSEIKGVNGRPPEYFEYTGKRNKRSVWSVATQPFAESHFATMPPEIAETCILAGSSERGCCPSCGAPWVRLVERKVTMGSGSGRSGVKPAGKGAGGTQTDSGSYDVRMGLLVETRTIGWRPTCSCPAADSVPCTVLDPFGGAGTTGLVADRLGRNAILIELNADYCAMAERRLRNDAPLFADVGSE